MLKEKRMVFYYMTIILFFLVANFAHPVTPTFIVERQLDNSMFGVALAAMMCANFAFAPFWGKLCSYIPTKLIMLICGLGYALGQLFFFLSTSEAMLICGRMFSGIFVGGIITTFANYIINVTSDTGKRSERLIALATVQTVAEAGGYFIGGMLGVISYEVAFIAQIVGLVICGLVLFVICEDDSPYKQKPNKTLTIKEANPFTAFAAAKHFMTPMMALIFIIVALTSIGKNSFDQSFNYYIKDQFNLSSAYNGIFKALIAVVTFVVNSTACRWLQRHTDTNISFMPVMICCTIPLGTILFFDSLIPFVIVDIIFFAFNAMRLPLLQNICVMRSKRENSNQVMGLYQAMGSLGGIFGALFAGLIYDLSPLLPFILAFAAFAMASVVSLIYVGRYKKENN